MKKIIILFILLMSLSGCSKEELIEIVQDKIPSSQEGYEELFSSLPDDPQTREDIFVITNGGLLHKEVWDSFYDHVSNGQNDQILIARYTIEGDVIYELLICENGGFALYSDNSRDAYASAPVQDVFGKYLYYYETQFSETADSSDRIFLRRFCFLSDTHFETEDEFEKALEENREGKRSDLSLVWSDEEPLKKG
ncbi:MAG: DUF4362 domain-containing protein [Erysipelotrichaceae bacterium]|nr:DUF4362 domain-containing protein [Erysipelotrichaceae bacterium]